MTPAPVRQANDGWFVDGPRFTSAGPADSPLGRHHTRGGFFLPSPSPHPAPDTALRNAEADQFGANVTPRPGNTIPSNEGIDS